MAVSTANPVGATAAGAAALAFGATRWCQDRAWYGPWVRRPACVLIALAGVVWMVERLFAA